MLASSFFTLPLPLPFRFHVATPLLPFTSMKKAAKILSMQDSSGWYAVSYNGYTFVGCTY